MSSMMNVNQVLRVKLAGQAYKGLIVNMGEEAMLVATTSSEKPDVPVGAQVTGEIITPDGLFHFNSRLLGIQTTPVMILILERPTAMRKIQRRREPRHPVALAGLLVFISADHSINTPVEVINMSFGGVNIVTPATPPLGFHCILLLRQGDGELSTICRVIHADEEPDGFHVGLSFVEMSRRDVEGLHRFISVLDESSATADAEHQERGH